MNKEFTLTILVLLYNKETFNSVSLQKINESKVNFLNSKLIIWNNGPNSLLNKDVSNFKTKNLSVELVETIDNKSLAFIYNQCIELNNSKKYLFLDDDSEINDIFLQSAIDSKAEDVSFPVIYSGNKIVGPIVNGTIAKKNRKYSSLDNVMAIGSGMVIGKEIVNKLITEYGNVFDERFYLYGVDTSFCLRINRLNLVDNICIISGFEHSLSRLTNEKGNIVKFRIKERAYEQGLFLRYYHSRYKSLFIIFRGSIGDILRILHLRKGVTSYNYVIKAFVTGRHYRDKNGR